MSKYTISNAFSQTFRFPIWKIEIDETSKLIAIECRDPENTLPYITVMDFQGMRYLDHFMVPEKEWTLAAIQDQVVILKKIAENSPISPGVWMLYYKNPNNTYLYHQYQYLGLTNGYVHIRPQHITSGFEQYFSLLSNKILSAIPEEIKPLENQLVFPMEFNAQKPDFLQHITNNEDLWISKCNDHFLWSFHERQDEKYHVRLLLSDKKQVFDETIIISNLNLKLIQIYFQVGCQIFLLTHNKQEFVSYLV